MDLSSFSALDLKFFARMASTDVPLTHNWAADTWDWPLEKNDGVVKVLNTKDQFQVGLAVADFRPDEIKVMVVF